MDSSHTQLVVEHKRFSPSQAERFFRCPGSIKRLATVLPRDTSPYAEEGNIAHELLDVALRNALRDADVAWHFTRFSNQKLEVTMQLSVQDALDYIYEIKDEYPDAVVFNEAFVDLPVEAAPGEAGGYCDVFIWVPSIGRLYVMDYKHGIGVTVYSESNKQILQYTSAVVFGDSINIPKDQIKELVGVIVQPRSYFTSSQVRETPLTMSDLFDYVFELEDAIALCLSDDAPLVPDTVQCQFCDAVTTCPAIESKSLSLLGVNSIQELATVTLPAPEDIPADRLAYIMQGSDVVKKWLKEVHQHAYELARKGVYIPGKKLVDGQASREWYGLTVDAALDLCALTGAELDEVMPRKMIGVTAADKLVKRAYQKGLTGRKAKKAAAERGVKDMAFLTLKTTSGSWSLVDETDSRPAVNPAAAYETVNLPTLKEN